MSVLQERAQRRRRATAFRVVGVAAATAFACWLPFQLDLGDVGLYDRMGLYALVAIGLTLLMGFAGQVSLGQGGFFLIGAYTSGLLTVGLDPDRRLVDPEAGIDPLLAVAAAPFVSAAVAAAMPANRAIAVRLLARARSWTALIPPTHPSNASR